MIIVLNVKLTVTLSFRKKEKLAEIVLIKDILNMTKRQIPLETVFHDSTTKKQLFLALSRN